MRIRGPRRWTATQADSTGAFAENIEHDDFDPFTDFNYPTHFNGKDGDITPDTSLNVSDNSSPTDAIKEKGFFKKLGKKIGKRKAKKEKANKGDLIGLVNNDSCVIKFNLSEKDYGDNHMTTHSTSTGLFDSSFSAANVHVEGHDPAFPTTLPSYSYDINTDHKDNQSPLSFFGQSKSSFHHSHFPEPSEDRGRNDPVSSQRDTEHSPIDVDTLEAWKPSTNAFTNSNQAWGGRTTNDIEDFMEEGVTTSPLLLSDEEDSLFLVGKETYQESSSGMCRTKESDDSLDKFNSYPEVNGTSSQPSDLQLNESNENVEVEDDPASLSHADEGNNSVVSSTSNLTLGMLAQISGLVDVDDENVQQYGKTYSQDENEEEDDVDEVEKAAQLSNDFPSTEIEELPDPMRSLPRTTSISLEEVDENENVNDAKSVDEHSHCEGEDHTKNVHRIDSTDEDESIVPTPPSLEDDKNIGGEHPSSVRKVKDTWIQRDARSLFYKKYEKDINIRKDDTCPKGQATSSSMTERAESFTGKVSSYHDSIGAKANDMKHSIPRSSTETTKSSFRSSTMLNIDETPITAKHLKSSNSPNSHQSSPRKTISDTDRRNTSPVSSSKPFFWRSHPQSFKESKSIGGRDRPTYPIDSTKQLGADSRSNQVKEPADHDWIGVELGHSNRNQVFRSLAPNDRKEPPYVRNVGLGKDSSQRSSLACKTFESRTRAKECGGMLRSNSKTKDLISNLQLNSLKKGFDDDDDDDNQSCCSRSSVADKIAAFEKPPKKTHTVRGGVPKIPPTLPRGSKSRY